MANIALGAFEPDRAGLETGLLTLARNAYPSTVGWGPMPSLSTYGSGALPTACKGLFCAKTDAGAYQVYAGTRNPSTGFGKLYKLVSGVWTDYTRTVGGDYTLATGAQWRGAQWG